ncbi:uncharacterized protein LOC131414263 [Diceros bicornis minor]|uniref:uncharacterized protein LOC131414263 n=1 Tax=Diceros bicornis minor TaxID=77932 RepID=UPI0026F123B7|nr:uncharacterized protein LOC131414263 [Diceros bicornis minor]
MCAGPPPARCAPRASRARPPGRRASRLPCATLGSPGAPAGSPGRSSSSSESPKRPVKPPSLGGPALGVLRTTYSSALGSLRARAAPAEGGVQRPRYLEPRAEHPERPGAAALRLPRRPRAQLRAVSFLRSANRDSFFSTKGAPNLKVTQRVHGNRSQSPASDTQPSTLPLPSTALEPQLSIAGAPPGRASPWNSSLAPRSQASSDFPVDTRETYAFIPPSSTPVPGPGLVRFLSYCSLSISHGQNKASFPNVLEHQSYIADHLPHAGDRGNGPQERGQLTLTRAPELEKEEINLLLDSHWSQESVMPSPSNFGLLSEQPPGSGVLKPRGLLQSFLSLSPEWWWAGRCDPSPGTFTNSEKQKS